MVTRDINMVIRLLLTYNPIKVLLTRLTKCHDALSRIKQICHDWLNLRLGTKLKAQENEGPWSRNRNDGILICGYLLRYRCYSAQVYTSWVHGLVQRGLYAHAK